MWTAYLNERWEINNAMLEENRALLVYYTASGGRLLRLFGSKFRIHPQGSRLEKKFLSLENGSDILSQNEIRNYHY